MEKEETITRQNVTYPATGEPEGLSPRRSEPTLDRLNSLALTEEELRWVGFYTSQNRVKRGH
jgi:hypothetical protein